MPGLTGTRPSSDQVRRNVSNILGINNSDNDKIIGQYIQILPRILEELIIHVKPKENPSDIDKEQTIQRNQILITRLGKELNSIYENTQPLTGNVKQKIDKYEKLLSTLENDKNFRGVFQQSTQNHKLRKKHIIQIIIIFLLLKLDFKL